MGNFQYQLILHVHRNDFESGGAWSPMKEISSKFCLICFGYSITFKGFGMVANGKWYFYGTFFCKEVKKCETHYLTQNSGEGAGSPVSIPLYMGIRCNRQSKKQLVPEVGGDGDVTPPDSNSANKSKDFSFLWANLSIDLCSRSHDRNHTHFLAKCSLNPPEIF